MSEDYVNQLTLNFLISKTQLAKLNKKITQDSKNVLHEDKEKFRKDIVKLFNKLLENDVPLDLLQDVRDSFDHFIEKSIYYLKVREDNNKNNEYYNKNDNFKEDVEETSFKEEDDEDDEYDDGEHVEEEEEEYDDGEHVEEEEEAGEEDETMIIEDGEDVGEDGEDVEDVEDVEDNVVKVHKKVTKTTMVSNGVDDIQKLPLDWFNNIRQNYKKTQILSRKKELIIPNNKLAEPKRKI
jgi:hypothetical protein